MKINYRSSLPNYLLLTLFTLAVLLPILGLFLSALNLTCRS